MKKSLFVFIVLLVVFGVCSFCFSGQPDEDKLIKDLYESGAMTGYAVPPATRPFWYRSDIVYYGPYYWIQYNKEGALGYNIEVKPAGRVLIHVDPVDAEVYIDGRKLQQLPDLTYQAAVFTGTHHIDIIKRGYEKFSEDVIIQPGSGLVIPIKLKKTGSTEKEGGR